MFSVFWVLFMFSGELQNLKLVATKGWKVGPVGGRFRVPSWVPCESVLEGRVLSG